MADSPGSSNKVCKNFFAESRLSVLVDFGSGEGSDEAVAAAAAAATAATAETAEVASDEGSGEVASSVLL
jgi:hypothetical protein